MQRMMVTSEKKSNIEDYVTELKLPSEFLYEQDIVKYTMEMLGFLSNRGGVCFGTACVVIEYMLTKNIKEFNHFFELLNYIYSESFKLARKNLWENHSKEYEELDDVEKKREFIFNLVKKEVKINFEKLPEQIQFDLNAFLSSIEIYQQAYLYPHLFPKQRLRPINQNMILTSSLVLSENLIKLGGIQKVTSFYFEYLQLDFIYQFLLELKLAADDAIKRSTSSSVCDPITLLLGNQYILHAIAISFDVDSSCWTILNPGILAITSKDTKEIAKKIVEYIARPNVDVVEFEMTTYITNRSESVLHESLIKWRNQQVIKIEQRYFDQIEKPEKDTPRYHALEKLKGISKESKTDLEVRNEIEIFREFEEKNTLLDTHVKNHSWGKNYAHYNRFSITELQKKKIFLDKLYTEYADTSELAQRKIAASKLASLDVDHKEANKQRCNFFYRSATSLTNSIKKATCFRPRTLKLSHEE